MSLTTVPSVTAESPLNMATHTAEVNTSITQINTNFALLSYWEISTTYIVGKICYLSAYPYIQLECVVAGTSGTIEPTSIISGATITDGTVIWLVKDIRAIRVCYVPIRQTVLSGAPTFLNAVSSSLAISELASGTPLITTWANGFDAYGEINYILKQTADVASAWSGLTASSTLYLYKDYNATTGIITYGFTTLAPVYQNSAPSSPSAGQYWFDIVNYKGYYYSGSAWVTVLWIFVGECTTGTSSVSNVICYAIQGKYDSEDFTWVNGTSYTKNHNLGINPEVCNNYIKFRFTSSGNGYNINDYIDLKDAILVNESGTSLRSRALINGRLTSYFSALNPAFRDSAGSSVELPTVSTLARIIVNKNF